MPPHPDILKKMELNQIEIPWTLKNIHALREKGIDAPQKSFLKEYMHNIKGDKSQNILNKSSVINFNALVLLVEFPDKPFKTAPNFYDKLLFSGESKTLPDYLLEVSYGTLNLTTANLPSTIGIIKAPQSYSYYVNSKNGLGAYPNNTQKLVEDVIKIIDPTIDFSKYDNNGDGYLDALFIIHSGPGAEFTSNDNDIWSHAWEISQQKRDNVNISAYSTEPEYWSQAGDMTFGVFAHEMGHSVFGLPDLYDYDEGKNKSAGLGEWSLMAGGSWNGNNGDSPAHPDIWCKSEIGIVDIININYEAKNFQIKCIMDTSIGFRVWKNGSIQKEYFLIENRRKKGYDSQLPGEGLLIYHIDDDIVGNDHQWYPGYTSNGHYKVALKQADGNWDLEKNNNQGDVNDPYPGNKNNINFSSNTNPNTKSYTAQYTNVSITNISNPADIMTADISLQDYIFITDQSIDYGYVEISESVDTTNIVVENIGSETITLTNFENFSDIFQIKSNISTPFNIEPGSKINFNISFTPENTGAIEDSLILSFTANKFFIKKILLKGKGFKINPVQNGILYGAIRKINEGTIINLNTQDASAKLIGKPGFPEVRSLTISNKTKELFGVEFTSADTFLCRINSSEGDIHRVCRLNKNIYSIAFDTCDVLYGSSNSGYLFTINQNSGECEFIGKSGLKISDIKFNPLTNEMYGCIWNGINKDAIYKISVKSADTILVGKTGFNIYTQCLAFDNSGNLYGIRGNLFSAADLIMIDPQNGKGTFIGTSNYKGIRGLAIWTNGTSDIYDQNIVAIKDYFLNQNYPNPFNPLTKIKYQIPEKAFVVLKVYDLLGKEVATLVNKEQQKGIYSVDFKAAGLSSGVYIYQIKAKNFIQSKKLTLLK